MAQTKVLVLGAGKVGKSVAELLLACGRGAYHVTIADRGEEALREASRNLEALKSKVPFPVSFDARRVDVSDGAQVRAALAGHDAVVCMLPFNFVKGIAEAANELGVHYFDVTEDVETTDAVREIEKSGRAKVALVPQCGLAPGYIAIAAHASRRSSIRSRTSRSASGPCRSTPPTSSSTTSRGPRRGSSTNTASPATSCSAART